MLRVALEHLPLNYGAINANGADTREAEVRVSWRGLWEGHRAARG